MTRLSPTISFALRFFLGAHSKSLPQLTQLFAHLEPSSALAIVPGFVSIV